MLNTQNSYQANSDQFVSELKLFIDQLTSCSDTRDAGYQEFENFIRIKANIEFCDFKSSPLDHSNRVELLDYLKTKLIENIDKTDSDSYFQERADLLNQFLQLVKLSGFKFSVDLDSKMQNIDNKLALKNIIFSSLNESNLSDYQDSEVRVFSQSDDDLHKQKHKAEKVKSEDKVFKLEKLIRIFLRRYFELKKQDCNELDQDEKSIHQRKILKYEELIKKLFKKYSQYKKEKLEVNQKIDAIYRELLQAQELNKNFADRLSLVEDENKAKDLKINEAQDEIQKLKNELLKAQKQNQELAELSRVDQQEKQESIKLQAHEYQIKSSLKVYANTLLQDLSQASSEAQELTNEIHLEMQQHGVKDLQISELIEQTKRLEAVVARNIESLQEFASSLDEIIRDNELIIINYEEIFKKNELLIQQYSLEIENKDRDIRSLFDSHEKSIEQITAELKFIKKQSQISFEVREVLQKDIKIINEALESLILEFEEKINLIDGCFEGIQSGYQKASLDYQEQLLDQSTELSSKEQELLSKNLEFSEQTKDLRSIKTKNSLMIEKLSEYKNKNQELSNKIKELESVVQSFQTLSSIDLSDISEEESDDQSDNQREIHKGDKDISLSNDFDVVEESEVGSRTIQLLNSRLEPLEVKNDLLCIEDQDNGKKDFSQDRRIINLPTSRPETMEVGADFCGGFVERAVRRLDGRESPSCGSQRD